MFMWAGNGRYLGENRNAYRVFVGASEERKLLENVSIDGMITLKWITKNKTRWNGSDSSGLELGGVL
jgi:hypothetical protein